MKPPHNVSYLEKALRVLAGTDESLVRLRRMMANVVAGQFLGGAVMRGGGSLKLRYGERATRYTMDFDAARKIGEDEFVERYNARLAAGWNLFSGRLVKLPKAKPRDIPEPYVMQPFEVKLTYKDHSWCTVELEVSHDEVGDADDGDSVSLPDEVLSAFSKLGFPEPSPVPLMRIAHQMAQKLHGATDTRSCRAQDLIDLQLMVARERIDYAEVNAICRRLFAIRKRQPWPAKVIATEEWRIAYEKTKGELPVLPSSRPSTRPLPGRTISSGRSMRRSHGPEQSRRPAQQAPRPAADHQLTDSATHVNG